MAQTLKIVGGRIIDPRSGRDEPEGQLLVANGKIVEKLTGDQEAQAEVINAKGLVVCSGFIDLHTHLREPGGSHKETIETGTRAAAAGGFTTVVCMPNTSPPCDTAGTIQFIKDRIASHAVVNVLPTGCLTEDMRGEALAPIGQLAKAGACAISDGDRCVQSAELMRRVFEYAAMFDLPVISHCQDYSLTKDALVHEGVMSLKLGLKGWPAAAEDVMVARDAVLATQTRAHLHIQHLSSSYSVDIVRRMRARGVFLTAEVTPHHLALTDAVLDGYGTQFKVAPPLRSEADRQALIRGLVEGTIDCIASGHAPHTDFEKDMEFDYAPFGVVGLETAFSVCNQVLVEAGHCSLPDLLGMLTDRPARVLGLEKGSLESGADADITLIDPAASWTVEPSHFQSKASNCPWAGKRLPGKVVATVVGGRIVYREGRITSEA